MARKGGMTVPPTPKPVDVMAMARAGASPNQRSTRAEAGSIEKPAEPSPKRPNSAHSCQGVWTYPISATIEAVSRTPAQMMRRGGADFKRRGAADPGGAGRGGGGGGGRGGW